VPPVALKGISREEFERRQLCVPGVEPKRPPKRTAPDRCQGCGRSYGADGPFRFRKRWLCSRCLLADSTEVDDRQLALVASEP